MYGKMKYVRFVDFNEIECIIVFSTHMNHRETVRGIGHIKVVSAGFVYQSSGLLFCEGRSESLNVDSNPEADTKLLRKQLQGL
ncbi:MAG: hypothetical protein GOVbin1096_6 [Prokaryotic dsDNA virus sp.]|jgi:hypothetical protein|nr:MAG: hypothetical protein GOVbin1096_6 [Prokaryotic dsDNA virus sp.]|tara:strand:- start:37990 stop:38238 length:249 start_codon:yes stop_codon:yes gene_type:complete